MSIADNLAYLMQLHHLSENRLARALDTSVMTVRRLLSGETEDPRILTLKAIADYFNTSVDFLLHEFNHQPLTRMPAKISEYIPVLAWDSFSEADDVQALDLSTCTSWYPVVVPEKNTQTTHLFALRTRPSMQPRFPLDTILVIKQSEQPLDGDLVVVKMRDSKQLSLRELKVDSPYWQLQPVVAGSEVIFFRENQQVILGVVLFSISHSRHNC